MSRDIIRKMIMKTASISFRSLAFLFLSAIVFASFWLLTPPVFGLHLLYGFEDEWEREEWRSGDADVQFVSYSAAFATQGDTALRFEAKEGPHLPRLETLVWDNDWSRFEFLAFDLVNPGPEELRLKGFIGDGNGFLFHVRAPAMSAQRYVFRIKFPAFARKNNILEFSLTSEIPSPCVFHLDRMELLTANEVTVYDRGKKARIPFKGDRMTEPLPDFAQAMAEQRKRFVESRCDDVLKMLESDDAMRPALRDAVAATARDLRKRAKDGSDETLVDAINLPVKVERARATNARADVCSPGKDTPFLVLLADAETKVFPRDRDADLRDPADGIAMSLARGEKESVQIVVEPLTEPTRGVRVTADDLVAEDGSVLPSSQIDCDLVAFVRTPRRTDPSVKYVGWHPDPLIPSPKAVDVALGDRQPWWIRVRALPDQKPGLYQGKIRVESEGAEPVSVAISVRVRDFLLPPHSPIPLAVTYKGFGETRMTSDPERWKTLRFQHADVLGDYLLNADDIYRSSNPSAKNAIDWEVVEYQRAKGQLVGVCLGYFSSGKDSHIESFRAQYEEAKRRGLLDHVYIYGFDERPASEYKWIEEACEKFRKCYPEVMVMVTAQDHSYGFDSPMTNLTAWCPILNRYNPVLAEKARGAGRRVWWYTCNWPPAPYPNVYVDYDSIDLRVLLGLANHKYRPDGFLYYHTVIWAKEDREHGIDAYPYTRWNPWNFMDTNGDGSLFCIDSEGRLLGTIRMENWRDGLEDLAWLMVLDATREAALANGGAKEVTWANRAAALSREADALVPTLRGFTRDASVLRALRERIGDCLEEAPLPAEYPWKDGLGIWGLAGNPRRAVLSGFSDTSDSDSTP